MIEVRGDLWKYPADIRVITTNGSVNRSGNAVMGRGCALEAATTWPQMPGVLGRQLKANGNHVYVIGLPDPVETFWLLTFPVKDTWSERARTELIIRSCKELLDTVARLEAEAEDFLEVVMPRPGCGFGGLRWGAVKVILDHYLDDRFRVITWDR